MVLAALCRASAERDHSSVICGSDHPDRPAHSHRRAEVPLVTLARRPWDPRIGPLQVATIRQALEREGMVTAWWSDMPGAALPLHAHAFPETRWIVEGYLRITAGDDALALRTGDRTDLPPNPCHTPEVGGLPPVHNVHREAPNPN